MTDATDLTPAKRFTFDGRSVAWDVLGDGPPLVVTHGTPWSSWNMRALIRGLAADHRVFFWDLLGYGASDMANGDVSLAIQNRVLDALLDHWGLTEPAALGHDFGGATVLRAHLLGARAFRTIVLIDPVAIGPWGSPFFGYVRDHESVFAGVPDYIHEAIVRAYISTAARRPLPADVLERTVQPWLGEAGRHAFYRQIAQADMRHTAEVEPRYPGITTPTLVLWGEDDAWIPVERGVELAARIPTARLVTVPDAGHLVIEERPEVLLAEIRSFLAGVR